MGAAGDQWRSTMMHNLVLIFLADFPANSLLKISEAIPPCVNLSFKRGFPISDTLYQQHMP